jgi:hypothetical protein
LQTGVARTPTVFRLHPRAHRGEITMDHNKPRVRRRPPRVFAHWLPLCLACGAQAHVGQEPVTCTSPDGQEQRVIFVDYTNGSPLPCRTYYTKWGKESRVASADNTPGVCERVAQQVIGNLTRAGYQCVLTMHKHLESHPAEQQAEPTDR